ncbi:ORF27 [Fowl aviadenovirus B]|uniref:ORF27 n=2 Tax=Fowl aviadenovirus B TaxID=190062 RepID=R4MS42_9ADEN|nr:ORF27 [Fowl aviadenovirus 5]QCC26506.1 ORF27 [Fowl aviadenovirus B]AGL34701.1 ORF27 [Fowl aviadenovirus 5]QSC42539.1 ORF27 [Fowl aviadenovirus 5]UNG39740.1 ORF27 [Fowl aviadenovirus B]UNG39776.1 ORF27 [Fowl aviadenovirus B]
MYNLIDVTRLMDNPIDVNALMINALRQCICLRC